MQYLGAISKMTGWSRPFLSKPFNNTVIQVNAPTTNAEKAEVDRFYENLQDLLELTPKKRCPLHHRGLECKTRKSRDTYNIYFSLKPSKIDAFELWCWRRLLRVSWNTRRSNQSILNGISPEHSLEAETLILWLPDVKNWLIGKDPDAGKDWRQEEKGMTEDAMVGWHHWLDGHEFEQALGSGYGQRSLACCSPWGHKESDTTEWLNRTELKLQKFRGLLFLFPLLISISKAFTLKCVTSVNYKLALAKIICQWLNKNMGICHLLLWKLNLGCCSCWPSISAEGIQGGVRQSVFQGIWWDRSLDS